jgi:hypothetical protein
LLGALACSSKVDCKKNKGGQSVLSETANRVANLFL